jgi:parallel beta helix pectate lyase-like protein
MRKISLLGSLAIVLLAPTILSAQASRTWVSGVGDDANPCSRTAPCKTWAGAISKTAPGGEIDALDPGGFGAVTITKSITFDGGGGQVASVLVAGTNGIVVQAANTDVVILRNLRLNGLLNSGNPGLNGIQFNSGKSLTVENCYIFGFSNNGINVTTAGGQVFIEGTSSRNNGGSGLAVNSTGATFVAVDSSHFDLNVFGVRAQNFSTVNVSNSTASGNSNTGFISEASAGTATLNLFHCAASGNVGGIQAGNNANPGTVNVSDCAVFGNIAAGYSITAGSTLKSWGNTFNTSGGTTPQAPNLTPQ